MPTEPWEVGWAGSCWLLAGSLVGKGTCAITFHPSSDWTRRLARSVITDDDAPNSRLPANLCLVVANVVVACPQIAQIATPPFPTPRRTGAVDISRVSDQLTYTGRRS